jgi:perosamine synthetase
MNERILYTKPSITDKEVDYAADAARNGWGERCYEYIGRFENLFCDYTKASYSIATSSCTGALHMGMAALDIGLGDEVIMADTGWVATASSITYLGAKPVFVDVLPDTWCIDPVQVESAITPNTKAIIAVHLYGNLCEMNQLLKIGEKHGIPVIEDSAEALGSHYLGKHVGTIGKFGTYSFHGTKTITTGEGGMFITNDKALYEKVLALSNHGRSPKQKKQFWSDFIGYKYKISNIQAAIGCAQMERIEDIINRKRKVFEYYKEHLCSISGVTMNPEQDGTLNSYWMPTVVFDKALNITREKLIEAFSKNNIDARVFFYPLSSMGIFGEPVDNMNSYDIPERAFNLPSYYDLSSDEQDRVVNVIKVLISENG